MHSALGMILGSHFNWNPRDNGASAWWDVNSLSGVDLSSWVDRIQGSEFTATGTERPTLVATNIGTKACPRFNGSTNKMASTLPASTYFSTTNSFAMIVYRPISVSRDSANAYNNDGILCFNNHWGYYARGGVTTAVQAYCYDGAGAHSVNNAYTLGTAGIWAHIKIGSPTYTLNGRLNANTLPTPVTADVLGAIGAPLLLGAGGDGTYYGNFDIGDIVIFPAWSATLENNCRAFLNAKFGIY
jgi:hypothetical protein